MRVQSNSDAMMPFNMDGLMIPRVILLLVATHVADCQLPTVKSSNTCQFGDQPTNALLDVKKHVANTTKHIQTDLNLVHAQLQQLLLQSRTNNGSAAVKPNMVNGKDSQCRKPIPGKKPGTPIKTRAFNGSTHVAAIALLKDQLYVARDGVAQVSVYNTTTFQLQRQLTFNGLGVDIRGLATCYKNNYLYISEQKNLAIHRVDLSVGGDNTLITWTVAQDPHGLSVNSAGHVLVASYSAKKVQEYTPTGSLVREISDNNNIWQAVELSSGILAISQRGPLVHGVSKLSIDTHFWRHTYGNQAGSGAGQMNNPSGLSVDNDGYILVADLNNNRILVLNPCLTDARQLPLPFDTSLHNPISLALDHSHGRLYVGESGGQNRVLAFDHVTNIGSLFDN